MSIEGKSISESLVERLMDLDEWMEQAACLDEDVQPIDEDEIPKMMDLCQDCPVVDQCKSKANYIHEEVRPIKSGVFGGESYFPRRGV